MIVKKIKTELTPFQVFRVFSNDDQPVFLDSGEGYENLGKFSIIASNPFLRFRSKNNKVIVDGETNLNGNSNPLEILKGYLNEYKIKYHSDLPFIGGALGHFSYDLCHHFEELPRTAVDDLDVYDINLGFYNGSIIYNHDTKEYFVTDAEINSGGALRVEMIIDRVKSAELEELSTNRMSETIKIESNMTKEKYIQSIKRIKNYIKSGDIYQVNMTQRFQTKLRTDPLALYSNLRAVNSAPFAAFLDYGDYQILSSSPERFMKLEKGKLSTRPIKGTRPRGKTSEEDHRLKEELLNSEKDRAELLMIVDLERNDFSKVAKTGTVKVPELFVIEEYPTVNHLVSKVVCELDKGYDAVDCIENTFPGGSITGAPKIRAMEIIDELEPTQRNIYTGSIGYIDFNGNMDLSIVIRTMLIKNNNVYFQVGGGIVWDSNAADEFQESLDKGKALIEALKM
ncbi:MAG TPA: aminodeoxychorismate synthase component I [Clostridia bacterium]|nr:aminodeoxychorismate synthase component I [Clostridia bacterium]